jgi:hypothetical protein
VRAAGNPAVVYSNSVNFTLEEEVSEGSLITDVGEGYGHHGACSGWNGCGDAATCALWACMAEGYSELVSYGVNGPDSLFSVVHLFYSQGNVDYDWMTSPGGGCGVSAVGEIQCANPVE